MSHRRLFLAGCVLLAATLAGCEDSLPSRPLPSKTYVSFLDKGVVYPHAVATLVYVDAVRITLVKSRDGAPISRWSSWLERRDFDQLLAIVKDNGLLGAPDPPIEGEPCLGGQALVIALSIDGVADTITVAGSERCDSSSWPTGLSSLLGFEDSLVKKYEP